MFDRQILKDCLEEFQSTMPAQRHKQALASQNPAQRLPASRVTFSAVAITYISW
jgi:hypothetical protein